VVRTLQQVERAMNRHSRDPLSQP